LIFNKEEEESEPSTIFMLGAKSQKRADVRPNTERKLVIKKKFKKEESDIKSESNIKSES